MKNIVLIIMDCARKKLISPELSPFIWSLKEKGVSYEQHYATAPWTLPSHTTLFTGLYTREHQVEHENLVLHPEARTISQEFRDAGFHTACFTNNPWVGPLTGLDRGFEHFEGVWHDKIRGFKVGRWLKSQVKKLVMEYSDFMSYRDSGADKTNKRIYKWNKERDQSKPYFLFCNFMECHLPYKPPEPFRSKFFKSSIPYEEVEQDYRKVQGGMVTLTDEMIEALEQLCSGEIAYLDSKIEELFNELDDGNTIWIITSDHGDLLGEDGLMSHRFSLHRNLLHVPLILYSDTVVVDEFTEVTDHINLHNILFYIANGYFLRHRDNFGKYVVAEHTSPVPMLYQLDELRHFGDKFDVDEVDVDLISCLNEESQIIIRSKDGATSFAAPADGSKEDLLFRCYMNWGSNLRKPLPPGPVPGLDAALQKLRDEGFF